jgi:hypothetical protein
MADLAVEMNCEHNLDNTVFVKSIPYCGVKQAQDSTAYT